MKKKDHASGVLIDVPDNVPPLGQFPFYGFWQQVWGQIPSKMEQRTGLSKYDVASALSEVEKIANGSYQILVGEKLWKIGNLLTLNQYVPASGNGGKTLGYIETSPDGGRTEIAAVCFEPIVNAVLMRASVSGDVGQEMNAANHEQNARSGEMQMLMNQLANLENSRIDYGDVENAAAEYKAKQFEVQKLEGELGHLSNKLSVSLQREKEYENTKKQLIKAEMQLTKVLTEIDMWQKQMSKSQRTGNGTAFNSAKAKLTALGKSNATLHKQVQNLGIKMQRMGAVGNDSKEINATMSMIQRSLNEGLGQLSSLQTTYQELHSAFTGQEKAMAAIRREGASLSQDMTALNKKRATLNNSLYAATQENETDIVKVWVNHLTEVYRETEGLLFENLRRAQKQAMSPQGQSVYMSGKPIRAETVAEMEAFLSATDQVKSLDRDEIDVLEQIARLGTALDYVPGAERILALKTMAHPQRKAAYRNMITEIVSFGERPASSIGQDQGWFDFGIGDDKPLFEVAELVRSMTDTILGA